MPVMRRITSVSQNERDTLKSTVDLIGRPLVAKEIDMPYNSLCHKLNGQLPLSKDDYNKIFTACDSIRGANKVIPKPQSIHLNIDS